MKKFIFAIVVMLCTITANAQVVGSFHSGDSNAWFDKEIFFYAKNNLCNAYGYGINIPNVSIVVNNE